MNLFRHSIMFGLVLFLLTSLAGCSISSTSTSTSASSQTTASSPADCEKTQAQNATPDVKRLAEDLNHDWARQAIHAKNFNSDAAPTVVAVIDSGIDPKTPHLLAGYNAVQGTTDTADSLGHGSSIAALILQIAPQANLLPVKVMDQEDEQSPSIVARGIDWAVDHGAQVINLSLAMPNESSEMQKSIQHALDLGITVIAASGNDGREFLPFPANQPGVLSVVARDINNVDVGFSNVSMCKKSFSAPGVHVQADLQKQQFISGTSFATAYVTGTVAQMLSANDKMRSAQVEAILKKTSIYSTPYSNGLIQTDQAIRLAQLGDFNN